MNEFSRTVRIDTIGDVREVAVEADAAERQALARRFDIADLRVLTARAAVRAAGSDHRAEGTLHAELVQTCAATGAELPATIDAPFAIAFRTGPPADVPEAGLELSADDCDVVFFEGGALDLGEAVAETLALAIDPFARAPNADAVLREAGVLSEEEARAAASPFAGLAGLNS